MKKRITVETITNKLFRAYKLVQIMKQGDNHVVNSYTYYFTSEKLLNAFMQKQIGSLNRANAEIINLEDKGVTIVQARKGTILTTDFLVIDTVVFKTYYEMIAFN